MWHYSFVMNCLSPDRRVQVVSAWGITHATYRMTAVAKHTFLKLLKDLGWALRQGIGSARGPNDR